MSFYDSENDFDYELIEWSDDDEIMALHVTEPPPNTKKWVDFPQFPLFLSEGDKAVILSESGWLNDSCINGMMIKLKTEFPNIKGFQVRS